MPIRFHLRRLRDLPPDFQRDAIRRRVGAYINPVVDPYEVNIITDQYDPMENILSHETLHAAMAHIGERYAAASLDQVVHRGVGIGRHGFTDNRIPESRMGRELRRTVGNRPHPTERSRFEKESG